MSNSVTAVSRFKGCSKNFHRTLLCAGMLALSGGALAQYGNQPSSVGNDTIEAQNTFSSQEFHFLDSDKDNALQWREIASVFDKELEEINWDQEHVMQKFDADGNNALSNEEYQDFLQSLVQKTGVSLNTQPVETESPGLSSSAKSSLPPSQDSSSKGVSNAVSPTESSNQVNVSKPATMANVAANEIEALKGRKVINLDDENIGTVKDVVVNKAGTVEGVVVGIGGVMTVGEKKVFISSQEVHLANQKIVWRSNKSKEEVKQMPAYDPARFSGI